MPTGTDVRATTQSDLQSARGRDSKRKQLRGLVKSYIKKNPKPKPGNTKIY
jgi:hypothetical protein